MFKYSTSALSLKQCSFECVGWILLVPASASHHHHSVCSEELQHAQHQEKITQSICVVIEQHSLQPSVWLTARDFVKWCICCQRTISHLEAPSPHAWRTGTRMLRDDSSACKVALTADSWTAVKTESTVTYNYNTEDWWVTTVTLLAKSLPGRHTTDHLVKKLIKGSSGGVGPSG